MVVKPRITSVEYPETIQGREGEEFDIVVNCKLEGEGSSRQYIELYVNGTLLGEGVTDSPWEPNGIKWTSTITVQRDLPRGQVINFEARVGHLEDDTRVKDDSRTFAITVGGGIPWWAVATAVSMGLAILGLVWIKK